MTMGWLIKVPRTPPFKNKLYMIIGKIMITDSYNWVGRLIQTEWGTLGDGL